MIDPVGQDLKPRAYRITDGRGYDVVIDASGSARDRRTAGCRGERCDRRLRRHVSPDYEMPLNLSAHLYRAELTITGVFISPYAFPRAVQSCCRSSILDELTQIAFPLDQAAEAFAVRLSGEYPKVLIECNPPT